MTIKTRLICLGLVPVFVLVAMGVFGGQALLKERALGYEMKQVAALTDVSVQVSLLVHELQKERGRTSGFYGSRGEKFGSELADQRRLVDEKLANLRGSLEGFDLSLYRGPYAELFEAAMADLEGLEAHRRAADGMRVPLKDALAYYTKINNRFLDAIGSMAYETSDASLSRRIKAYELLLKGKERSGLERAVLSNTFAQDKFGPGMYPKLVSLVTVQETYLAEFKLLAMPEDLAFFNQAMAHPAVGEVIGYRDLALSKADTGGFGADPLQWFSTVTVKIDQIKAVENHLSDGLKAHATEMAGSANKSIYTIGPIVLLFMIVCPVVTWRLVRSVTVPIGVLAERIETIQSSRDLTQKVELKGKHELARLGECFNSLVGELRAIISEVRTSSNEVAAAATEVAASSEEISVGIGEQTSRATSMSAAVEQISSSVSEVARQAVDVAEDADRAGQAAAEGQGVVRETVEGMQSIRDAVARSSEVVTGLGKRGDEIGEIIAVINDIADQTNLLALNAAIEAARAGEHGKGFAVVADEVRKLADRTTQATNEIAQSITAIQEETSQAVDRMGDGSEQVEKGVSAAMRAGESLEQIVETSRGLAGKVQAIAAAAEQQSAASTEVAEGVESISAVTQESLSGSQQAAVAAEQLSRKATELQVMVDRFKT
ncbi:MAG: methyl-accepting chemotaxis protein [Planctomycetota bacterium]